MATAALGMLRIQAVLKGMMVRHKLMSMHECKEAGADAAQLQDTMAAWRKRTGKVIASMVLSATMTMAITKAKIRQQRLQARARIEATMQIVQEVLRSGMKKDKLRQAYFRLAATYAMVEIRRVVRYLHNREIEAQRDEVVQRHCSVVLAETINAALMAGASARCTIKRNTGVAMRSALAAARCRTAAGASERQLYRAVYAKCEIKRKAAVAMISTLAAARYRTAAGVSERQLYWAVYALRQHVAVQRKQTQGRQRSSCRRSTESGDRFWRITCINASSSGI